MMIVYMQLFEKVFDRNNPRIEIFSFVANVRSLLSIANINDNTEVKADRYPQYEVYEHFLLIKIFKFFRRFISMHQRKIKFCLIKQYFYIKFFPIH